MSNLILFGFKGVGKTYFGKLVADALKLPFIDTDDLIEKGFELSVKEIYEKVGEEEFRKIETKVILELIDSSSIIALGGGAPLSSQNIEHLQKIGQFAYLFADFPRVEKRVQSASFLTKSLYQTYLDRMKIYEKIPAKKIDLTLLDDERIVEELKRVKGSKYGV